jgi:hypothetical protein
MVEVDVCERDVGFVLSVGPVSLWLGPATAIDVLDTLARAIKLQQRQDDERAAPSPPVMLRRRIIS